MNSTSPKQTPQFTTEELRTETGEMSGMYIQQQLDI